MEEKKKYDPSVSSVQPYKKNTTDFNAILGVAGECTKFPEKEDKYHQFSGRAKEKEDEFRKILEEAILSNRQDDKDGFESYPNMGAAKIQQTIVEADKLKKEKNIRAGSDALETDKAESFESVAKKPKTSEKEVSVKLNIEKDNPVLTEDKEQVKQTEKKKTDEDDKIEEKEPIENIEENQNATQFCISENHLGDEKSAAELFGNDDTFIKEGTIRKKFNPHPDENLIAGKDFHDPSLDEIYCFEYSDDIIKIRERKARQKEDKIAALLQEEQKKEEKRRKAKKQVKKRKKVPSRYPKTYIDPTDEEIDDKTGKPYYYFNFQKTLANSKFKFLSKILPVQAIDEVLYDKGFLDGVADRQHEKAVKLNSMSAEEQYSRDLRNTGIKIAAWAFFIFAVFFKVSYDIIPDNKYNIALNSMMNKQYEESYYQFTELGTKNLSVYYAKYSEAKMHYLTGNYEKASEAFSMLIPYAEAFKPLGINIENEINECRYQTALDFYYAGNFQSAKDIFKEIYSYSDAKIGRAHV